MSLDYRTLADLACSAACQFDALRLDGPSTSLHTVRDLAALLLEAFPDGAETVEDVCPMDVVLLANTVKAVRPYLECEQVSDLTAAVRGLAAELQVAEATKCYTTLLASFCLELSRQASRRTR